MTARANRETILVGAVIYDPKVSLIWDIITAFFAGEGCPIDCVFYSNYELQVSALAAGHIDIAWNSPLAWVDALRRTGGRCRALAMRDTDRDRISHILVRRRRGIDAITDLRGRTLATGAIDSPQATLLPIEHLRQHGLAPGRDFTVRRHDLLVGKHGDHIGGEKEALRSLHAGDADAACMLDLNWNAWRADGTIDPAQVQILTSTPPFDHCNFTVLDAFPDERARQWTDVLFRMRYDNPAHREMMDLEGLTAWLPGRTTGYAALTAATAASHFFEGAMH
jgi:ABC-type phosphate/phosphonate transport system substrate-binding protein